MVTGRTPAVIQVGDRLPDVRGVFEFVEAQGAEGKAGLAALDVRTETAGKRVVIFGLPGAFTPTCSEQHVPGYVEQADALRAAGIDEIWCVAVNDAFVMGAWGRDQHTAGKVRMVADGSAAFSHALGLTQDLSARGMGIRSLRYAMVVEDGVVQSLAIETPGKLEVSDAASVLASLKR